MELRKWVFDIVTLSSTESEPWCKLKGLILIIKDRQSSLKDTFMCLPTKNLHLNVTNQSIQAVYTDLGTVFSSAVDWTVWLKPQ